MMMIADVNTNLSFEEYYPEFKIVKRYENRPAFMSNGLLCDQKAKKKVLKNHIISFLKVLFIIPCFPRALS